jgi:hypothetical protein
MTEIIERIISVPEDSVIKAFTSIPWMRNNLYSTTEPINLYRWDNILISDNMGLLVVKMSSDEMQEFDSFCASDLNIADMEIELPVLRDYLMGESNNPYLHNSNIWRFLSSVAERNDTITIYYRFSDFGGGTVWAFDASIFDCRVEKSAYSIFEYFDQGSITMGQYASHTKYLKLHAEVVNGYQGDAKTLPFDIPLIEFARNYWLYERESYQDCWKKLQD